MSDRCVMPEMPYCPCCEHGIVVYPEDATSEDVDCEWVCLLQGKEEAEKGGK